MHRSLLCVALVASAIACRQVPEQPKADVTASVLPLEVAGWTADSPIDVYDSESIFAYIDGHAEVYLAYGMQRCVSRRYAGLGEDSDIVVDLFEMASPADAYGVFSHDRRGEDVDVGQGGVYRHGWLSFWKGSWSGSVTSMGGDAGSREAVLAVGKSVADELAGRGEVPAIVSRLPTEGLDPASVCFLRSPTILNAHVFVGSDNPFNLGFGAEAVVGTYDRDGVAAHLVVVEYPNESEAKSIELALGETGRSDAGRPAMSFGRNGSVLAAVVGAEEGERGEALLDEVLGGEQ